MNASFWNLFSTDYRRNCLAWEHGKEPILPPSGNGWESIWTANPDLLTLGNRLHLYYRGHGTLPGVQELHDRIGVSEVIAIDEQQLVLKPLHDGKVIVDVGRPEDFDGTDALDPATVIFDGKVFLYYSATGPGPDSIGLSISEDGVNFSKHGKIMVGRAPDVIVKDGRIAMLYQRADEAGNYQIYLAASDDGISFEDVRAEPVFQRAPGGWDSLSIATVRLSKEDETYYAIYGGSSYLADEPDFFGLARSHDLIDWEFHPGNPIFGCGPKGAPDGGAMWFPALYETAGSFVILYEGSRGKYGWDLTSQICLASIRKAPL